MMNKIITASFIILCMSSSAHAARLYFEPSTAEFTLGKEQGVVLMLDPEGESINALELVIEFPTDLLAYRSALTGESVVSMWIERPTASGNIIRAAGIMPGGFSGVIEAQTEKMLPGPVASFLFLPTKNGSGKLEISKVRLIKSDGLGTELRPELIAGDVSVVGSATSTVTFYDSGDVDPPENFSPVIFQAKSVNAGKYSLVFNAEDKGSGIDHYEIKEGKSDFSRATSPYLLADQSLGSIIYVRAIDVAGNERTVQVNVEPGGLHTWTFGVADMVLALVVVALLLILWYTRGRHHPS